MDVNRPNCLSFFSSALINECLNLNKKKCWFDWNDLCVPIYNYQLIYHTKENFSNQKFFGYFEYFKWSLALLLDRSMQLNQNMTTTTENLLIRVFSFHLTRFFFLFGWFRFESKHNKHQTDLVFSCRTKNEREIPVKQT